MLAAFVPQTIPKVESNFVECILSILMDEKLRSGLNGERRNSASSFNFDRNNHPDVFKSKLRREFMRSYIFDILPHDKRGNVKKIVDLISSQDSVYYDVSLILSQKIHFISDIDRIFSKNALDVALARWAVQSVRISRLIA